jgi:hypothetical protein
MNTIRDYIDKKHIKDSDSAALITKRTPQKPKNKILNFILNLFGVNKPKKNIDRSQYTYIKKVGNTVISSRKKDTDTCNKAILDYLFD